MSRKLQVGREHYHVGYNTSLRKDMYHEQIQAVIKTKPRSVLEIGIGNGYVARKLKERILQLTGFSKEIYTYTSNI